jgi:hypothetical protein
MSMISRAELALDVIDPTPCISLMMMHGANIVTPYSLGIEEAKE